jgi:hypothetical protein
MRASDDGINGLVWLGVIGLMIIGDDTRLESRLVRTLLLLTPVVWVFRRPTSWAE